MCVCVCVYVCVYIYIYIYIYIYASFVFYSVSSIFYTRKTINNNLYFMLLVLYFCGFVVALMAEQQYGASCKNGAFFSSITFFYIWLLSPYGARIPQSTWRLTTGC